MVSSKIFKLFTHNKVKLSLIGLDMHDWLHVTANVISDTGKHCLGVLASFE